MRNILLLTVLYIIYIQPINAQTKFKNGYIIKTNGEKVNCLIKNNDWNFNPTTFKYKLSENSETLTGDLQAIQEFADDANTFKYIKATVNIDHSSDIIASYSKQRNPEFKSETVFLKELLSGKVNLYVFKQADKTRYFYKFSNSSEAPIALVFKNFMTTTLKASKNEYFKQQIINTLKCPDLTKDYIKTISYHKSDLIKVYTTYNNCGLSKDDKVKNKTTKTSNKWQINTRIKLGANFAGPSLSTKDYSYYSASFDTKATLRGGIELEFILPFNNNKWAIFLEPSYQGYKEETTKTTTYYDINYSLDYASIEVPIGLRHYFFINDNNSIFIDACYYPFDFMLKNDFYMSTRTAYNELKTNQNFGIGIGYRHDKLSIQLRQNTTRNLLSNYINWTADYKTTSLILGYTIF
ncbi:hypothetical protein NBRC110019_27080 [Neptunitalea chrysea]|uniref:tRNA modification GTPase n=1 Tax=Neptunitalea chrysea TaxID=1647581 RepID=A0A9W6B8M9_9FLAO|nr:tRNA modification GTPase [Neptunitalea chrysea]GLB53667.1 hypothetical protein NBRC110019_27080 [Neptunitalea chrysea]